MSCAFGALEMMPMKQLSGPSSGLPGLLQKAAAIVVTAALAGVALMFSAMVLAVLLMIALLGAAYLWWKTRGIRKQMREFPFPPPRTPTEPEVFEGEVIEGEVIRVDESRGRR